MRESSKEVSVGHYRTVVKTIASPVIASFLNRLILHPLDTVTTLQQKNNTGLLATIRYIYTSGGMRQFYRGLRYPLFASIPNKIATYGVYYGRQEEVPAHSKYSRWLSNLKWGVGLGVVDAVMICPIENLRIRATVGLSTSYRFKDLSRGFVPTLVRGVMGGVIILAGSDAAMLVMPPSIKESPKAPFMAGFFSGTVYHVVSTPVEVLKTRMMASDQNRSLRVVIKEIKDQKMAFRSLLTRNIRGGFSIGFNIGMIKIINQFIEKYIQQGHSSAEPGQTMRP